MMVKRYRKKPVEVLAMEWTGKNKVDVQRFVGQYLDQTTQGLIIPTLEGDHYAAVGDFIIQGVKGEFYPCKPDIFWATYEAVMEEVAAGDGTQWIDTGVAPNVPYTPATLPPVKSMRMYDGDKLIHDYTPCTNEKGAPGMYDLIEETFCSQEEFSEMVYQFYSNADSIKISYGGYERVFYRGEFSLQEERA